MANQLMRVIGTHPDTYTVDVEDWRTGWKCLGVPVMVGPATARTGLADLPVFSEENPGIAIVDTIDGAPIVMGFLNTRISQMRFADGRAIWRHESDVYLSVGRDGEMELRHPSGAMIRIGESAEHEDLTGTDYDREWAIAKNTGKNVNVALEIGDAKVTMNGTSIELKFGEVVVTLSAGGMAIVSPALTHNGQDVGDTHVHGGVVVGGSNTGVPA